MAWVPGMLPCPAKWLAVVPAPFGAHQAVHMHNVQGSPCRPPHQPQLTLNPNHHTCPLTCRVADVGLGRYVLYFALYMTSVEFFVYWQHRILHLGIGYRCEPQTLELVALCLLHCACWKPCTLHTSR